MRWSVLPQMLSRRCASIRCSTYTMRPNASKTFSAGPMREGFDRHCYCQQRSLWPNRRAASNRQCSVLTHWQSLMCFLSKLRRPTPMNTVRRSAHCAWLRWPVWCRNSASYAHPHLVAHTQWFSVSESTSTQCWQWQCLSNAPHTCEGSARCTFLALHLRQHGPTHSLRLLQPGAVRSERLRSWLLSVTVQQPHSQPLTPDCAGPLWDSSPNPPWPFGSFP